MSILQIMLVVGIIGHGLNLYCDRTLSIFPNGKLMIANIQKIREGDYAAKLMEGVSPSVPLRSGVWGVFAIFMEYFGYLAMATYAYQRAPVIGVILFLATTYSCIISSAYHVKCGLAEYVFLKNGCDERAKETMLDLMDCGPALRSCFVSLLVYIVTMMVAIVTGAIGFPLWAVIFTTLPIFILLYPFKIIGSLHIGAMVSMLVWMLLI